MTTKLAMTCWRITRLRQWLWLVVVATSLACARKPRPSEDLPAAPQPKTAAVTQESATRASAAAAIVTAQPTTSPCPSDMVLAEGLFCPAVEQRCQQAGNTNCPRYEPSRCLSERKQLVRVCIDRFEWPNQLGQKPLVLVSFDEAQQLCETAGKRLCDEQEWSFACEGEHMLPYSYGYERDPTRCVIDRLATKPILPLVAYDQCMDSDSCRAAFSKIDQREPAGSFRACVSPVAAHDMTGNVSEWVHVLAPTPGRGVRGGNWGPGPAQCRAETSATKAAERSPEVGFRCCRNAHPG